MNSYDQLIYLSEPKPQSHPAHLATIAALFGMQTKSIENARILELGSGTGGNIIPLAEHYPNSSFLGIDYSKKQIEYGNQIIKDLEFRNIELEHQSILDFEDRSEKFDFIICHGVYSWVSKDVQDKIFKIISNNLSENGLAYVSYNTHPGWKPKQALREMMHYHTQNIDDPKEKVNQAKALLGFLIQNQIDPYEPYAQFLQASFEELRSVPNYYFFHEYLEEQNQAFYFHEFISKLNGSKLKYLCDANFSLTTAIDLPKEAQDLLRNLSDRSKQEQYLDFIRNRKLRESILCLKNNAINYPESSPNLSAFYISSEIISEKQKNQSDGSSYFVFQTAAGGEIKSSHEVVTEAIRLVQKIWPAQIKFEDLLKELGTKISLDKEQREFLEEQLFLFYSANLLELNLYKLRANSANIEKPLASKLARYQATKSERVSSNLHNNIQLEPIVGQILSLLDGNKTRSDLIKEAESLIKNGKLVIETENDGSEKDLPDFFETIVDRSINFLAKKGFLN